MRPAVLPPNPGTRRSRGGRAFRNAPPARPGDPSDWRRETLLGASLHLPPEGPALALLAVALFREPRR